MVSSVSTDGPRCGRTATVRVGYQACSSHNAHVIKLEDVIKPEKVPIMLIVCAADKTRSLSRIICLKDVMLLKVGFHYPSSRAVNSARELGP